MTKKLIASALMALATLGTANAGGILTNTNQSIAFLRMPAREASIGIDGVYSNPAGVAFLKDGWHFGANWQCAVQTRTVEETSPYLDHTLSGTPVTKRYRGHATAPCIPSVAAAYNWKDKWSFQFNFAVSGGGGKCQYENGLGAFEGQVGQYGTLLSGLNGLDYYYKKMGAAVSPLDATAGSVLSNSALGVKGYGVDCYMEGRQYYFGVTLGAAYKITPNLSVYAGVRGLIANASYSAKLENIQVATTSGLQNLNQYAATTTTTLGTAIQTLPTMSTLDPANAQQYSYLLQQSQAAVAELGQIDQNIIANNGIDLSSDQSGFGISPIIGVDYKLGRFNFAAKYEFRTKMTLKNNSNLAQSTMVATSQYEDGTKVREDSPAMLAFGVQYSPVDIVRVNLGYHHFYDMDAKKTYFYKDATTSSIVRSDNKNDLLKHGSNEYLGGVEVDCTDRLIVSCGAQITRYGMTDEYMNDQSFVTNSWSLGFGASYQANPNVKIEAAYFKTFYNHYKTAVATDGSFNDFTRTNDVIGVGLVIDL